MTPLERMNTKLHRRVLESGSKLDVLKPGETFDIETGEIKPLELPPLADATLTNSTRPRRLRWGEPVRNRDGSGHQLAIGADYEVRKTLRTAARPLYWAWCRRKLLGYSIDVGAAYDHCEGHHEKESDNARTA